ncbi:MAG: hydroxypyruvate isomerase family protein [Beutenbergiaceae bacterium]
MILRTHAGAVRLAANLKWMFTEVDFDQRFDAAAECGFTGVEFASPYALPAGRVRQLLDQSGLALALINTPAGPADSPTHLGSAYVPGADTQFRDGVHTALEYATILGAPTIHVMAGICPPEADPEYAFANYVTNIDWAAVQARTAGIRIALEPLNKRDQPHYGLRSMETAAAVARAVDPDTVGVLFDFYHAQVDRGDLLARFDHLQQQIVHVQVADNPGRGEPGTGEIAYERVFPAIAGSSYQGWVGCEYAPQAGTREGLTWIEKMGRATT